MCSVPSLQPSALSPYLQPVVDCKLMECPFAGAEECPVAAPHIAVDKDDGWAPESSSIGVNGWCEWVYEDNNSHVVMIDKT